MNPVLYQGCRLTLTPTKLVPTGLVGPWFELAIDLSPSAQPVVLQGVHVSDEAMALIASGAVVGASVETLQANSLASSMLGNAKMLLTGLQSTDGTVVCTIPKALRRTRFLGLAGAAAVGVCALIGLLEAAHPTICGLLLVGATHALRSFWAIPASAFPDLKLHEALEG